MPEQAAPPADLPGRRPRAVRALAVLPLALAVAAVPAGAAAADGGYGPPVPLCQLGDPRLAEVSGLATAGGTLLAMNDGGSQAEVYVLDAGCAVAEVRSAPVDPYDPEDLALAGDGTLWLADTGDNRQERATVALIGLRPDGTSSLTRLTYPDGAHDVEALLLAPDGTPYLVSKEVLGASSVYRPDAALADGATLPMSKVADLGFTLTGTPGGPVGRAGQLLVTGGAVSADGRRLALRTYTDAYVWALTGSDVVGALHGTPVRVPLPEAPQGEAISFAANSRDLVVAGEGLPSVVTVVPAVGDAAPAASADPTAAAAAGADEPGALAGMGSTVIAAALAAAVATIVVWTWSRLRRRG
jgi:sugar lactone lactonase YvrE